jgi:hypothetical protein
MATNTSGELNLIKPALTDKIQTTIADLATNFDTIDDSVSNKVDKVTGKGLSTEDYTSAEKTKLLGIEANAKDDQAASEVPITDTGDYFTSADVEGALQETGGRLVELDSMVGNIEEQLSLNIFRYGIKIDKNDSNPDTRVEYLYDAVGMNPAYMDYTTGEFNFGSWRKFAEWVNTPVMLNYDGTVAYELDRNDQTLKADGTASDIDNPSFEGNAMSQFKRLWVNQYEDITHEYYIFSNVKYNEDYQAYAFTDKDGNVNDYMYRAMFDGYYDGTKLRSIATGAAMASQTGQTEIARAEANGAGWNISYKSQRDFITYLLWLISKSTNTQAKFGKGNSNSSSYINPGALKSSGQFMGYDTETQAVKVFYIEHFWGNYWERLAGHIMDLDGQVYTKMTPPYPQPELPGENVMPAGYIPTGITPTGASGSYIISGKTDPETGFVPGETGGSATQYYCDGMWYTIGSTINWSLVGGARYRGGLCGASTVSLSHPLSLTYSRFGAALSFLENAS